MTPVVMLRMNNLIPSLHRLHPSSFVMLHRRPVMLLEVLIAFALIVLCALPLIYPHVFILRSERKFVSIVELDHQVNLLFSATLEKLYKNEIPWSVIEGGKVQPLEPIELPFDGTFQFIEERKKVNKEGNHSAHIYTLVYTFTPRNGGQAGISTERNTYKYEIPIERGAK